MQCLNLFATACSKASRTSTPDSSVFFIRDLYALTAASTLPLDFGWWGELFTWWNSKQLQRSWIHHRQTEDRCLIRQYVGSRGGQIETWELELPHWHELSACLKLHKIHCANRKRWEIFVSELTQIHCDFVPSSVGYFMGQHWLFTLFRSVCAAGGTFLTSWFILACEHYHGLCVETIGYPSDQDILALGGRNQHYNKPF